VLNGSAGILSVPTANCERSGPSKPSRAIPRIRAFDSGPCLADLPSQQDTFSYLKYSNKQ
jgi:hypothetical protein